MFTANGTNLDSSTRVFHWSLARCAVGSVVTANWGSNAFVWRFRLGYLILNLLALRLVWGLLGGRWSRCASSIYSPATLLRYGRGRSCWLEMHDVGPNPLGALSVFAPLAMLAAPVGTGLFADDEIAASGPLVKFVSGSTSLLHTKWPKNYSRWIIVTLLALQVLANACHAFKKQRDLLSAMVSGDRLLPASTPASTDTLANRAAALVVFALCTSGTRWLVNLWGNQAARLKRLSLATAMDAHARQH